MEEIELLLRRGPELNMAPPSAVKAALQPDWVGRRTIIEIVDDGWEINGTVSDPPWFGDPPDTIY